MKDYLCGPLRRMIPSTVDLWGFWEVSTLLRSRGFTGCVGVEYHVVEYRLSRFYYPLGGSFRTQIFGRFNRRKMASSMPWLKNTSRRRKAWPVLEKTQSSHIFVWPGSMNSIV